MEHGILERKTRIDPRLPEMDSTKPDEIVYDEPFSTYLADRSCVSSSGLRKLIQSPYAFWWWSTHPPEDEETDYFRFGKAAHMMVLEPKRFRDSFIVQPDFGNMRTKQAQQDKKAWLASLPSDTVVLSEKELEMMVHMSENLLSHKVASNFFKNGKPEVVCRFTHKPTGIRCRTRLDYLCYDTGNDLFVFDLKTTRVDSESLFRREMESKGYYEQVSFYGSAVSQVLKKPVAGMACVGLSKSEEAGYPVWLEWIEDDSRDIANKWNDEALALLRRSLLTGKWPHQQSEGSMAQMSAWRKSEAFPVFDYND